MQEVIPPNNTNNTEKPAEDKSSEYVIHNKRKWLIAAILMAVLITVAVAWFFFGLLIRQERSQLSTTADQPYSNNQNNRVEIEENSDNQNSQGTKEETIFINEGAGELIQANINDLRKVGCCYYLDDRTQKIYHLEKYLSENSVQLRHASAINLNNFSVYENDSRYAHDSIKVYAVLSIPWSEDYEFGVIEEADPLTFKPKIVEQFDVSQGNGFQGWISRDKNHVYYKYEIFEHADPKSFVISENVSINKDKNNVYLWRKILPKADPQTYEILLDESAAHPGTVYGKDKNNFFVDYCTVSGTDTPSVKFEYIPGEGRRFSDKNGIFTIDHSKEQNTCSVVRE